VHINRFTKLYNDLMNGGIDSDWLREVEWRDNIFSDIDCAAYYLPKEQFLELINKRRKKQRVSGKESEKKRTNASSFSSKKRTTGNIKGVK